MSRSKNFEPIKFTKRALLASSVAAGSLGLAAFMGEGAAHASGPDMSYLVTSSAKKIVHDYLEFKHDPAIAYATTTGPETSINVTLPSVYGSYVLSATVSSLVNINPNTVSNVSIASYFPSYAKINGSNIAGYYNLTLAGGKVMEADALYVNQAETKYLNIIDMPKSYGTYNQPGSANITAIEYKAPFGFDPHEVGRLNTNSAQRQIDANVIGYTMDNLISEASVGMPIDGGTITPILPLASNFK